MSAAASERPLRYASCLLCALPLFASSSLAERIAVSREPDASPLEQLAAREVRRYWYLRTGELAVLRVDSSLLRGGPAVFVAARERAFLPEAVRAAAAGLGPQEFVLHTQDLQGSGRCMWIVGGDPQGALYGAYRFAERLGVRFYLHGDVIPDERLRPVLPLLNETNRPAFAIRGVLPFHDFPEGPDWWTADDYLVRVSQLAKLRLNFIGLHAYPESGNGAEPLVWIGEQQDADAQGRVSFSHLARWAHTAREKSWHYAPLRTSNYVAGAAQLFAADDYGPEVLSGLPVNARTPEQSNELFNRVGVLLNTVFTQARELGIKTCVGTETPLTIPQEVRARIKAQGREPAARDLYLGMFRRIAATHPLDYYWLWTPENWTWGGNKPDQAAATEQDIRAALAALDEAGNPFALATAGWVLGPKDDRAAWGRFLPPGSPMAALNRRVGHEWVDPAFTNIGARPKWAMMWLENDANMTAPQLWAGRMRYDAADARRLGCTGLIGKHWRTTVLAPTVGAFAAAVWDRPGAPVAAGCLTNAAANPDERRALPVDDFYADFCRASFGDSVATNAAAVFARMDGRRMPEVAAWKGPGWIKTNKTPWGQEAPRYTFVIDLEKLRPLVRGAGNLERFDYWLNTFRGHKLMGRIGCADGALEALVDEVAKEADAVRKSGRAKDEILPVRRDLAALWTQLIRTELQTVNSSGELGTLANLEQLNRTENKLLSRLDARIEKLLGGPLPADCAPAATYEGPARLIVPTVRTHLAAGEALQLRIMVLDTNLPRTVELRWRPLGAWRYRRVPAVNVGRAVHQATVPPQAGDFEYHVRAVTAGGSELVWPATAPKLCQTVVRLVEDVDVRAFAVGTPEEAEE